MKEFPKEIEMDTKKRFLLMLRWSLTTTILTALFWTCWYLVFGEVPRVNQIQTVEKTTLDLPIVISRWWDIVFAPVWTLLLVFIFSKVVENNDDFGVGLVVGLGVGLGVGVVVGLGVGLVVGLGVGLGDGLGAVIKGIIWLLSKKAWQRFYNWLMVRDVA